MAESGSLSAMNGLGMCHKNGWCVDQDLSIAVDWFAKAAEEGCVEAQFHLGECYYNGEGLEKDYNKAFEWFDKAAHQGHHQAEKMLGKCYLFGTGVIADDSLAKEWFAKAAALEEYKILIEERNRLLAEEEKNRMVEEEAKRKAEEEERRKSEEEAKRKTEETLRLEQEKKRLKELEHEENKKEYEQFYHDFLENRVLCKAVKLFGKGKSFEILTTPLTVNVYNTFKMREMCKDPNGERLLDRYKDKQMVNELIALLVDIYEDQNASFTIPTVGEEVGAQSAKLIEKKGIYLVVHFPDFEE